MRNWSGVAQVWGVVQVSACTREVVGGAGRGALVGDGDTGVWMRPARLREFVQTHVILTILRVCWGGSILQLLTPDLVNSVMNSKLCQSQMLSQSKRALTPSPLQKNNKSPSTESSDESLRVRKPYFMVKASPDLPPNHHPLNLVMSSKFCENHLFLRSKRALFVQPKTASFVLAVNTGHILVLRRKTCTLLRPKTCAVLRARICSETIQRWRPSAAPLCGFLCIGSAQSTCPSSQHSTCLASQQGRCLGSQEGTCLTSQH